MRIPPPSSDGSLPPFSQWSFRFDSIFRPISQIAHGAIILVVLIWAWSRFTPPVERYFQGALVVLILMLVCSAGIVIDRVISYSAARTQSRIFLGQIYKKLQIYNFDEAISIAGEFNKSHIAKVVMAGLSGFQLASHSLPGGEAVNAARHDSTRAASAVYREMRKGLNTLATIIIIAPMVGVCGTVAGIIDSFRGCAGSIYTCMADTAERLSYALVPAALGLSVAVASVWCLNYLNSKTEALYLETEKASLELVGHLNKYLEGRA